MLAHELAHVVQQDGAIHRLEIEAGDTNDLVWKFQYDKDEMKTFGNFARKFGGFPGTVKFAKPHIHKDVTDEAKVRFEAFKVLVSDLSGVSSGKSSSQQKKANLTRRGIRRDMQKQFDELMSLLQTGLDDTEDHLEEQIATAAKALKDKRAAGAIKHGVRKKEESTAWVTVDPFYDARILIPLDEFRDSVRRRMGELLVKDAAGPALTPAEQLDLTNEQAAVNAQLVLWHGAPQAQGMSDEGTWGTSAGGVGAGWAPNAVSEAVFRKLRAWWVKKGGWTARSDTTYWSLKMDQDPTGGLSPRINYHLNKK